MVIPREQRYSTKNGSGLDSLGHFLAFLLLVDAVSEELIS